MKTYITNVETWANPNSRTGVGIHEGHLGGTEINGDPDGWHPEVWDCLVKLFNIKSMLDVGCGVGNSQLWFERNNIDNFGIDGTPLVIPHHKLPNKLKIHDLTTGPFIDNVKYDLVWSCDVFEHIEEQYIDNITDTLKNNCNKVIAFAAATPEWEGYHHVNCQLPEYWIDIVEKKCDGFKYNKDLSLYCREISPLDTYDRKQSFFNRSGLIFVKNE